MAIKPAIPPSARKVTLIGAISIGIGGMVGGGIFAVLGLASDLARGGTPAAFLFAGIIALLTSYSYVKLSQAYPSRGGTGRFVNEGFGRGVFAGGVNNLLWVSYIIMLSLYAAAFGSYAPNLLVLTASRQLDVHLYASTIVLIATVINYSSVRAVSSIESYAVILKLVILLAFIAIGAMALPGNANLGQLAPEHWESPFQLIVAGMIIFVAYEGFELIANAVPDLEDPERNVARAFYISVAFVIALYLAIAAITVGSLSFDQIKTAQDYVLAEAARPMLGQTGFAIITVAALISTFSAINASLLGGSRVSYQVAQDAELTHEFTRLLWGRPIGLAVIAVATLVMVNTLKLKSISSTGSIGFLLIFATVNLAATRKAAAIGASPAIAGLGTTLCVIALAALVYHDIATSPLDVAIAAAIIGACFIGEYVYKRSSAEA